jgi:hypothetical protein
MAFSVRSVSVAEGVGSEYTFSRPSGYVEEDPIYLFLLHVAGLSHTKAPEGWTSVQTFLSQGPGSLRCLTYPTGIPGAGPFTGVLSASGAWVVICVALKPDPDTTLQRPSIDGTPVILSNAKSATTVKMPEVVPGHAGDLVLLLAGFQGGTTFTAGAAETELADGASGATTTDRSLWLGEHASGEAGETYKPAAVTIDNPHSLEAANNAGYAFVFSAAPVEPWVGDFETGDTSQWTSVQAFSHPETGVTGKVEVRTDGPRQGTHYGRYIAEEPDTPVENYRVQTVGPDNIFVGDLRWLSWSTRFPEDFGTDYDRVLLMELFGPPFSGSPLLAFRIHKGDVLTFQTTTNFSDNTDEVVDQSCWTAPVVRGEWLDFDLRIQVRRDLTGWMEFWYCGKRQTFRNGRKRLYFQTMQEVGTSLRLYLNCYCNPGQGDVSVDHDVARVAVTPRDPSLLLTEPTRADDSRVLVAS